MASSSSSSSKCSKYDVFFSFSGETRKELTDNLYCTLKDHVFNVFIHENELTRGEIITQAVNQAVKDSRLAAIILSSGHQRGAFAEAFRGHQERFPEMVQTWKDALNEAAELAGEDFGATDG
ncbi:toll/interleukin-1 receptor-like protein [Pyrus communis]|uniref:toll/interleukin-1 receptor-like protein n=1 Tax=Pyrus communis TaxID=23211 RepID=UPI0035BF0223